MNLPDVLKKCRRPNFYVVNIFLVNLKILFHSAVFSFCIYFFSFFVPQEEKKCSELYKRVRIQHRCKDYVHRNVSCFLKKPQFIPLVSDKDRDDNGDNSNGEDDANNQPSPLSDLFCLSCVTIRNAHSPFSLFPHIMNNGIPKTNFKIVSPFKIPIKPSAECKLVYLTTPTKL